MTTNTTTSSAAAAPVAQHCRFCDATLHHSMIDLGLSPLCEDFIRADELQQPETFFPLDVLVCEQCWLVQVVEYSSTSAIFDEDYGYFSSYSTSWLRHAKRYTDMATERFELDQSSFVVEIASNDGYLLKNFVASGIPCLGIDPAANVSAAARAAGIDTRVEFFTSAVAGELADAGRQADLLIGNNVLAHTPYIKDFLAGVASLVKPAGRATFEFPHLLRLLDEVQFDTIYHEHYAYYSLYTVQRLFHSVGMHVFDVEELPTHGGSLRVFVQHAAHGTDTSAAVDRVLSGELEAGLRNIDTYLDFGARAAEVKNALLSLLIRLQREGKSVAGYGAPGKGNTLLNYCGIKPDLLPYTCDMSEHKHGRYCPGSRIPIFPPARIDEMKPDYILILPWNLQREIIDQLAHARTWGAKFIVPIPTATIIE